MTYKRESLLKDISDNLAYLSKSTSLENSIGLFDSNRSAQDFFCQLFSLIFNLKHLKNLDKLNNVTNTPAIDLSDEVAQIAIQITVDSSRDKISSTIDTFIKYQLYSQYKRLVVFIIGNKGNYEKEFDTKGKFNFDKNKDIWDDEYIYKAINKIDDLEIIEKINLLFNNSLKEYKLPERLFSEDIKKCISILKRDFGSIDVIEKNLTIRNDDFIMKKNKINNVSWDFFISKIRGHLKYGSDILKFLTDPINNESQKSYLEVSKAIQQYYLDNKDKYTSFEDVFRNVFGKLNTYDDQISGVKIKILLHNMYFNCDIGSNPDE